MSIPPSRLEFEQLLRRFEASERRHASEVEAIATEFKALSERVAALEVSPPSGAEGKTE